MKKVRAEIITIGDEILYGQITDTNSQFISNEMDKIGVKVIRQSSVGDEREVIISALQEAEQRADLILMTGGLGPTKDDITKKTLAEYFDTTLVINDQVLAMIEGYFKKRGREMKESNRLQAALPQACEPIFNRLGTAPGMWFEKEGKVFISMPGVPQEMKILLTENIVLKIQDFFQTPVIQHRLVRTFGAGESLLAEMIEEWEDALPDHIGLAYLPRWGEVKLRLTGTGNDKKQLDRELQEEIEKLVPLIEKHVYGYDEMTLPQAVGELLVEKGLSIASAESCTGGHIGHLITLVPGSSRYFMGGIIAYSNEVKQQQLGVKAETLKNFGAVSEETIREMAENVRKHLNTDIGVASSGIAGPGGGSPEKPVGTVWVAYADAQGTFAKKLQLTPDRSININLTSNIVLDMVRRRLEGWIN
ncbi:MAG: competence/damage-inducible protein A [Bacteroidota bacterium]